MALFVPPEYYQGAEPIIFLAGPINGSARWQNQALDYITNARDKTNIASPRYIGEDQEAVGDWARGLSRTQQIDWESFHLKKAEENGVILFWLANEHTHNCQYPYSQTTRFELGEWTQKHLSNGAKLVVGIDTEFPGKSYITYRIKSDFPNMPLESTLEATCAAAIGLIS
jgi:hypothetical protein